MRKNNLRWLWLAAFALAGSVFAAERSEAPAAPRSVGGQWSVLEGKTLGVGADALHIQVGWPGVSVDYLHGIADRVDLGARFSFNYGYEGYPRISGVPGLKLQGELKLALLDSGKFSLGLNFEPGMLFYFFRGSTTIGFALPVGLGFNLALSDPLHLGFSFDVPLWITFGALSSVTVPLLFGVGLEYLIDRNLALTFKIKLGPAINSSAAINSGTDLFFTSQIGIALKL